MNPTYKITKAGIIILSVILVGIVIYLFYGGSSRKAANYFTCAQNGTHEYSPILGTAETTTFICTQKITKP